MSEDAPVNTGVVSWPDPYSAGVAVRSMQTKLHLWAARDAGRRFGDLFNLVYDPAFLVVAWERVSTNKGASTPGIDKATAAGVEARGGVIGLLGCIREELKSGSFRPVEVRQVLIPKSNGKLRKLGIPTLADRVVQASLKLVLEPIFEADFKPCSYGFRPIRRAQDAISEVHHLASRPSNYQWVLEADIKACFDEISHVALMDRVRVRVKDKRVCALVKAFLKAGVMTELGDREETHTGTPQGGIISPLMANIALSALDDHFDRQWRQQMPTSSSKSVLLRVIAEAELPVVLRPRLPRPAVTLRYVPGWGAGGSPAAQGIARADVLDLRARPVVMIRVLTSRIVPPEPCPCLHHRWSMSSAATWMPPGWPAARTGLS